MGSGDHGNASIDGFGSGREDSFAIFAFHGRKFAGAAEGRDGIDAFGDQPVDMWFQAFQPEASIGMKGSDGGCADTAEQRLGHRGIAPTIAKV